LVRKSWLHTSGFTPKALCNDERADVLSLDELADLDGLIPREVGEHLLKLASRVPSDQAIVELGSYRGKSTCYLATGARQGNGAHVYAVDAWSEEVSAWRSKILDRLPSPLYADFRAQISKAGFSDQHVTAVKSLSTMAGDHYEGPPVGLLYIDGDHSKRAAIADLRAWRAHLTDDALVVFDDYAMTNNPGVKVAVEALTESGELADVQEVVSRIAVCKLGSKRGARKPGVGK
jgi:predicted O-methyltransferase YrrM